MAFLTRHLTVLAFAVLFAACSTMPVVPTKRHSQTPGQLATDETQCAAQTEGRENRDRAYAACLVARGYTMYVTSHRVAFDVRQTQPHEVDAVLADIGACDEASLKAQAAESGGEKAARIAGTVALAILFAPAALGAMGPNAGIVAGAFTDCMTPKGYAVERWRQ